MNTYTKYWFLEGFNLFNKLGRITMMRMCEILEMDNIDKGSTIELFNEDEKSIFFLKKGTVKIIDSSNNNVKYIVKKGHIFGELSLYNEQAAAEEQAIALEDCIVCYIESERMEQIMEKHKSLKNGVLKVYGLRIKKLERRLQDLLYKDSATRIKEFIIDYIKEFGEEQNTRIIAKNLLSHKDIANLTNTSRQTVSNVLSTLRKDSLIDYDSQNISISIEQKI
ncbi:Crp/Fnr family transcriptional regulator [Aquimarina sp. 2201CG14-23]|uniref:Crp/Fnr family transcriptional regulator n=1 Tax=Aquimarina mycalae TaxID=3040073 RepID=UPI002477D902|nr:Crp/Fnr family transcriptional regulator [Aquimarina sp. 2201CG14-23]MDH7447769.1 Crp/Fnr family transcriptional regulator [Aquimarina sp. 2201CG14-23]